jgi:hypothetical protein
MDRRQAAGLCALATTLGVLALGGLGAEAVHAPDHRFIVLGFVRAAEGPPLAGVAVVVTRARTGLEHRTRTEANGFYVVILHLHDEDEGELLHVSANGVRGEVRARFDPRDKRVERGTRLDVSGSRAVEDRRAFAETLRGYLTR